MNVCRLLKIVMYQYVMTQASVIFHQRLVETITLMADTPLMYGNYSSKMHPILPDEVNEVTHGTLGKDKINPQKILDKLNLF